jgi:hypothetical protein
MSQLKTIKKHLLQKGSITSLEAFRRYKITRLSARIYDLREQGMRIKTIMQGSEFESQSYAKYHLIDRGEL